MTERLILVLSCKDGPGIVAAVATCIAATGGNIVDSAQYGDSETQRHFMRVVFDAPAGLGAEGFRAKFRPVAERYGMDWSVVPHSFRPRLMILMSQTDHCANALLYNRRTGSLGFEVSSLVSNHAEPASELARQNGLVFHHLPLTRETKLEQETALAALIAAEKPDLIVLARYMQILSDGLAAKLTGRCINIHHSFLPSFKGARPYHQAHARGVKLIGATAHYVTAALDEGPIIEQQTLRVDHSMTAADFAAAGRDIEAAVLCRAVKYHIEHRVFLNGGKTVVFR